jgi:MoaA/NifB/PqqE/SkfB family radical SAM enzyme
MPAQGFIHTAKRYSTLLTHRISALPIAILMPHSACNCRCVMCDIWKDNKNLRQLTTNDVEHILVSLKKLDTKRVVLSGGEALLNRSVFEFCDILKAAGMRITLLSTGMTIARYAAQIAAKTDDLIVSLDGPEKIHDEIRNISGAFTALREGVTAIHLIDPTFRITARSVVHRLNYRQLAETITTALQMGLQQISFLPADVTSEAFNRSRPWEKERQDSVLVPEEELDELRQVIESVIQTFSAEIASGFISENPAKLRSIHQYYSAQAGRESFPEKHCNAPWVSAVVEADGSVRPCFFHDVCGNVRTQPMHEILNSKKSIQYRRTLKPSQNPTCQKCVCSLNLPARSSFF